MPRPISSRMTRLRSRGGVQNAGRLGHFDHERALAARQFVAGADPGEDPVGHADRRFTSRHEAADLGQQREQRRLANVRALAGHVGAGDQQQHAFLGARRNVVRHERTVRFNRKSSTGWRPSTMCSTGSSTSVRAAIASVASQVGQRRQHVDLGQGLRRAAAVAWRRPSPDREVPGTARAPGLWPFRRPKGPFPRTLSAPA